MTSTVLVVWDADGVVAGVVTSLDLVKAIARGAEFDVESPDPEATPGRRSVERRQRPVADRPIRR